MTTMLSCELSRSGPRSATAFPFAAIVACLALALTGCPAANNTPQPKPGGGDKKDQRPVRLLVVDDAPLAAAVTRSWQGRSDDYQIEVRETTAAELLKLQFLDADAVIYPSGLLGELVEKRRLSEFPAEVRRGPQAAAGDLLPLIGNQECSWGQTVYALPLGSPQLCLVYRRDIFQQLKLTPPRTWPEYQTVAERLGDRAAIGDLAPPADQPWAATIEPLAGEWAAATLLARAAAYARDPQQYATLFDYDRASARIAEPPYVRALEELAAARPSFSPDSDKADPYAAYQSLLSGSVAMAVTWPTNMAGLTAKQSLGFAPLPGADQYYSNGEQTWRDRPEDQRNVPLLAVAGRLASVTREARQRKTAAQVLAWIAGRDMSTLTSSPSRWTAPFRASQLDRPAAWCGGTSEPDQARDYGELVRQTQSGSSWLFAVRIPGRAQYLDSLSRAVRQAASGDLAGAEALQAAARGWDEITDGIGRDAQRDAYLRSLGREP